MRYKKVAIVHDDLVQWGGAERVLLAISEVFPDAVIYTSVFDFSNQSLCRSFRDKKIVTSFMQRIPGWRKMYRILLPLYPLAFESFDFSEFDLVISHTTRDAKCVITNPKTRHVCYCHTPPRYLWNFSKQKSLPRILEPYLTFARFQDRIYSKRVDDWLAGSKNSQKRIKKVYSAESEVLYPFVDDIFLNDIETFDGGYYLVISRLVKYKRVDVVIETFNNLGVRVKIVGTGPEEEGLRRIAKKNIEFFSGVSEILLSNLISGCRGVIITAEEDFGLVNLEAQALGKGVIAFGKGGSLESVIENKTGVFFEDQTVESLTRAIAQFERTRIDRDTCLENARKYTKAIFKERLKRYLEISE